MPFKISPDHPAVDAGAEIHLRLLGDLDGMPPARVRWTVLDQDGVAIGEATDMQAPTEYVWRAVRVDPGEYTIHATATVGRKNEETTERIIVHATPLRLAPLEIDRPVRVDLQRADIRPTPDLALWDLIRLGTEALSFRRYADWMEYLFCDRDMPNSPFSGRNREMREVREEFQREHRAAPLPFPDMDGYKVLVAATQAFLEFNCEVVYDLPAFSLGDQTSQDLGLKRDDNLRTLWRKYVEHTGGMLPYLDRVRQNLGGVGVTRDRLQGELCNKILERKFSSPVLLELIHTYWHEEGMLVQTLNAICLRFQNRRVHSGPDPLANLAIDPLRPLGNLLWGYIQDEQHRLTIARRAYEYDSEYGLALLGQAVPPTQAAESRSGFLAAFHDLLHRASLFYKEDDDTTIIADAFNVLSGLGEVHLLLADGAGNQRQDLTWTSRVELLIQQWLLARPEFREFLPTRVMVAYPEPWMDRVDAMKRLQGWTGTSVRYFHDLARFGERILLSIRYGDWSNVTDRDAAANWCRSWRQEVQWYIHAYQSVTGVDLSAEMADVRQAEQAQARALSPAFHLQRRLAEQQQRTGGRNGHGYDGVGSGVAGNGALGNGHAGRFPGQPA
jgi:hypothetical protein